MSDKKKWTKSKNTSPAICIRLDPELLKALDQSASKKGMTRAELVRLAIKSAARPS